MKKWRYRLPVAVLILGFGLGLPLLSGRLLNAHAWGFPEVIYTLMILPIIVPPLSFVIAFLFKDLAKLRNHGQISTTVAQWNWNRVRLISGILCWALIMYLIGRYVDSRTMTSKQQT